MDEEEEQLVELVEPPWAVQSSLQTLPFFVKVRLALAFQGGPGRGPCC
jgi:hypothetical protein